VACLELCFCHIRELVDAEASGVGLAGSSGVGIELGDFGLVGVEDSSTVEHLALGCVVLVVVGHEANELLIA